MGERVMANLSTDQIRADLVKILEMIRDDWNRSLQVTDGTGIFRDLGFESIDAVALGSTLEEHYNRSLPFAEFLTRVREQKISDITIGLLVAFLAENLNGAGRKGVV
jgi:acyl carrier protein